MRARLKLAALAALLCGCTPGGGTDLPDAAVGASAPVPDASASPEPSASADTATPVIDDWREAARILDWPRAWELLEALDDDEKSKPEMRLVRGRVALELHKHDEAVKALEGLDEQLPAVKREIRRWYAEAAAAAGPHDTAARLLEASPKIADLLLAAEAWKNAGNLKKARATCDKAVRRAQRNRRASAQTEAHLARAKIAEAGGAKAVAAGDYQWFVKNRPNDPRVRDAIAGVDRLGGVISIDDRITALADSASALNLDDTLAALDALKEKHPAQAQRIALGRARALYSARDYPRARDAFIAFAKSPSGFVAEALYYAARATARSGDQEAAVSLYAQVTQRFRNNGWAERAAYRHAEALLLVGRYADAARQFARYLSRYPKTSYTARARYGRAIALLSAGESDQARKQLAALRRSTTKRRYRANLRHLEGLSAARAGDKEAAAKIWVALIAEQPLTYPALAAHARLREMEHTPLPPLMPAAKREPFAPLPIALPSAPNLLSSLGLDDSAERRLRTIEDSAAKSYPGRESEALCEMYGQLSGARRRHQVGSRAVSLEVLMRPPSNAERWAWNCVYPGAYSELVSRQEKRFGLPNGFVHAIMRQESAFKTTAVSPVGAQGLMQLMPATAKRAAEESGFEGPLDDVHRPAINVRLGAFYLSKLLGNFGGHIPLAAAGYNAGPHAVDRWLRGSNVDTAAQTDLWIARIPYSETRHYVQRVLGNLARYQYLAGGVDAVTPLPLALPKEHDIGDDAY